MSWINTLRTSAEDLGTLAENDSSTDLVAVAFDHAIHSTVHRQGKEEEVRRSVAKKPPKDIGPLENAIWPDLESPAILLQRDSYVATQWLNGKFSMKN